MARVERQRGEDEMYLLAAVNERVLPAALNEPAE
jgi:hypothetical protein